MKRGKKEEGLKEEGRKGRQRATVKPLIMDPLKSRQQWMVHLPPIDFTIHFESPRSRHLSILNNGH